MDVWTGQTENSVMAKKFPVNRSVRGPYQKRESKPEAPVWNRNFLGKYRLREKLSQEDLAERAKLSVGTVSGIESGRAGFSPSTLYRLAKALGVRPGALLDIDPDKVDPDLWDLLVRATPDQQAEIARHAEIIVGRPKTAQRGGGRG